MNEFINAGDFAEVVVDTWAEQGLEKGAVVFIAQLKPLPISEEDVYLQRIYVGAHFTDNYSIVLPQIYLLDPRDLAKIDEETLKIYKNQMEIDFDRQDSGLDA